MYDLPPEFHIGLIGWKPKGDWTRIWPNVSDLSEIPSYPRAINIQHSMEYWLTLHLLSSIAPNVTTSCITIFVQKSTQSDVIFMSFSCHGVTIGNARFVAIERRVKTVFCKRDWWAHHPNSLLFARRHLGSAIFLLVDFGRYPSWIANVSKDVVAPYNHVVKRINASDLPSFEEWLVLVYFRGGTRQKDGGMIRQNFYDLMKDEKDVNFTFGRSSSDGVREASANFCLNLAGDTPSSNRLFDAIASHCVPVIISDEIELPFEDVLDYSKFAIFVCGSDAVKKGYLMRLFRGVRREKWSEMWEILKQISPHFEYQYLSQPGDAVDMTWQAVYRKVYFVCNKFRRKNRYEMSRKFLNARKMARANGDKVRRGDSPAV
ncbi:hypothetical protein L6452_34339 [Arctium lappa]|uniref:Uncharacterized protein n=1 Tax=Arctium lappa TaxID=4217 RepID=A0ACB8YM61_ARCLA|nr:hypothetical protein L6452_34339 [Arctium lappa]